MDKRSDDFHDEPGQMEGRYDLGRGKGYELSSPDGERRAGMVWFDAKALNETFQVGGPDGFWTERYVTECVVPPPLSGNHFSKEGLESLREARLGKRGGGNSKTVEWEGVEYESIAEMGRALGSSREGALYRLKKRDGTYVDKRPRKHSK